MLLGQHFDGREVRCETGAFKFAGLFCRVALCDQDEAVTGREVYEGFGDIGKKLNLVIRDCIGKADDLGVLFRSYRAVRELLEAIDKRAAKALNAVSMIGDRG